MESAWKDLSEHEIELEEELQKANITRSYDLLGKEGKEKIALIDLALSKILVGDYGICESCGDDIAEKRLEALPWTRLCIECAREQERTRTVLPEPSEVMSSVRAEDFESLTGDQLVKAIYEHLEDFDQIEAQNLKVSVKQGVVYLDGSVPSEADHQNILQLLLEEMGLRTTVDRLAVQEVESEEDELDSVPTSILSDDVERSAA